MVCWLLPGVARVYLHKRGSFLCPGSRITNIKVFQMSLHNTITSSEACRPSEDGAFEFGHHLLSSNPGIYSPKKVRNSSWWWDAAFPTCLSFSPFVYPLLIAAPSGWNLHAGLALVTSPPANTCWWVRLWHDFFCFVLLAALLLWACSSLLINIYPV